MVALKETNSQCLFKQVIIQPKIRDSLWLLKLSVHTLFSGAIKVFLIDIIHLDDFRSKDVVEKHD